MEHLRSVSATIGLLMLFPVPGALWSLSGRNSRSLTAWIDSVALGYAISILLLYVAAIQNYMLFVPAWAAATVISAGWYWRKRMPRSESEWEPYDTKRFAVLMMAAFALRIAPALVREFPLGWDPYFHLVVAAKIQHAGSLVADLQPIEAFRLNYPLGSHTLVALLSDLSGVPLHYVFTIAVAWLETLCVAQVFSLAWRLTKEGELALFATASFGLLAIMGSLGYSDWGGLPNLLAIYLFLGLMSLLGEGGDVGVRQVGAFACFYVAISVVHHHAMITVAAALIPLAIFQWVYRSERSAARLILWGGLASGIVGTGYFLPYLLRVTTMGTTGIPDFDEGMSSPSRDFNDLGLGFSFAAAMGVMCWLRLRQRPLPEFLVVPLAALLTYYVALKYVARAIILVATGRHISVFTPSRFLTDAVPLLAIFAAVFLWEMRRLLRVSVDGMLVVLALCFALNVSFYGKLFRQEIATPYQAAYAWLRQHSHGSAGILEKQIHGTYITGRVASGMPIPISEYSPKDSNKERLRAVIEGRLPASAFAELYAIEEDAEFGALPGPVVWADASGLQIRRLH